jgi:hypothetical protein
MPLSRRPLQLSLALALAGACSLAWAQPQPPKAPQQKPRPHAPREQKGLSESVRRAERTGQVLSAEQVQYDGRDVNRVKIVDDRGRVRVMWDDPAAQGDGKARQQQGQRRAQGGGRTRSDDDGDPNL